MNETGYQKCLKVLKKLKSRKVRYSEYDHNVLKFVQFLQTKAKILSAPKPTPLKLSTKSAACKLRVPLDRDKLCKVFACEIKKHIINKEKGYPIKAVKYGDINITSLEKMKSRKGSFNNQATIVVEVDSSLVNIKYFTNGSMSMTGCKGETSGIDAVKIIVEQAQKYPFLFEDKKHLEMDPLDIIYDYKTTLVNCDYSIGFNIDRNKLYKILVKEYGIFASFTPDFYHATKIGFMWNKAVKKYQDGVCECSMECICGKSEDKCKCKYKCLGKDKDKKMTSADLGYKERCCKKITMAVFENGKVIITGAHNMEQTMDTYNHMNKIFADQYKNIVKYSVNDYEKYIPTDKRNMKIMDYMKVDAKAEKDVTDVKSDEKPIKVTKKSVIIKKSKLVSKRLKAKSK